jgi:UDP-N-acetylmuramoyl-tripeptide--D-alanyl-D-alanine ligase
VGAREIQLSRWRGEEAALPGNGLLVNDAYNANPLSMATALEHLAERAGDRRRVAVLGDMAELGPDAAAYHREVGAIAGKTGVATLVAVGELARGYLDAGIPETRWAPDAATAIPLVRELVRPGDAVLVKGSRSVGLEAVADALTAVPA